MAASDLRVIPGGRSAPSSEPEELKELALSYDGMAEAAIISSCLMDPSLIDESRVFLLPEHFYSESHRRMYEALCALRESGSPCDVVTFATRLRDTDRLAQVGGMPYVTQVLNSAPAVSTAQTLAYAKSVRDKWARREMKSLGLRTTNGAAYDPEPVEALLARVRDRVESLSAELSKSEQSAEIREVLARTVKVMHAAQTTGGRGERPTGFDRVDRLTAGLHPELVLIGGRPGMAKTALGCAIAMNRAAAGEGAYIASLETQAEELTARMVCAHGRVELQRLRTGMMTPADWQRVAASTKALSTLAMWVDDTAAVTVSELWAKARRTGLRLAREGRRLGIVVVDYIQLLRAPRAGMKREEVIAENARQLKAMAQDLQCPVLALSQLNREVEKRPDKKPQISDLRESGELEQCARTVLLLYREDYYHAKDRDYVPTRVCDVNVAKQNNGPTGTVKLQFVEEHVGFYNLPDGEDEWRDD